MLSRAFLKNICGYQAHFKMSFTLIIKKLLRPLYLKVLIDFNIYQEIYKAVKCSIDQDDNDCK